MSGLIQIFNMALGQIGVTEQVQDLNERSLSRIKCSLYWDNVRDSALADYPWPFATKQADLAEQVIKPINWLFQYSLPSDCLRAQHLVVRDAQAVGFVQELNRRLPYELVWSQSGTALLCNESPATLQYTAQITQDTLYPPQFIDMVSLKLASVLAVPLKADAGLSQSLFELYNNRLQLAEATQLNQAVPFPADDRWITEFRSI